MSAWENRTPLAIFISMFVWFSLNDICDLKTLNARNSVNQYKVEGRELKEDNYVEYYEYYEDDGDCADDLPKDNCTDVLNNGKCGDRQDMRAMLCMKTCGYCNTDNVRDFEADDDDLEDSESVTTVTAHPEDPNYSVDDQRKECEDKLPTCSAHYSQEFCCGMKKAMNFSCEKTCKFCSQTPATLPPGSGIRPPAQVPTASTNQDPCPNDNEGKPPLVDVGSPGGQANPLTTTTTTEAPLAGILTTLQNTKKPTLPHTS